MANIKLNYTAFTSASMALKITAAMSHCLSTGEVVRVANRRGKEFLLVTIGKEALGYTFRFFSMYDHEEVGHLLFKAHHEWPESSSNVFWSMMSTTYDLTEHPLITERLRSNVALAANWTHYEDSQFLQQAHIGITKDANTARITVKNNTVSTDYSQSREQRTKDQIHKQAGATHKATDSLGRVVYLSYKRSWFGLGKTKAIKHVLEVNSEGLWDEYKMKVNGESFTIQGVL